MSDIVIVAIVTGSFSLLTMLIPLIFNRKNDSGKKIDELIVQVRKIDKSQIEMGDIMYQMLDHMATNNNTGGMKRCLDRYNEFNRHN